MAHAASSLADVLTEIAVIRASVADLAARLDVLLSSSSVAARGAATEACGPARDEDVLVPATVSRCAGMPSVAVAAPPAADPSAPSAKRAKVTVEHEQVAPSRWEVLPFRSSQQILTLPSMTSPAVRTLDVGEVLEGVSMATDDYGIDWLQLDSGVGYVAAAIAEQTLPGLPVFPAQPRLGRLPVCLRGGCGDMT